MLLELRRDYPKIPRGGHHFVEHGVPIKGASIDEVLEGIARWRMTNSQPLGNPEQDLARYYLTIAPDFVRVRDGDPEPPSDRQQVAEKTMAIWYARIPVLGSGEGAKVATRLDVCSVCPHRGEYFFSLKTRYTAAADARASIMTGVLDIEERGFCRHHLWLLELGARLAEPANVALQPAPPECWLNTL